MTTYSQNHKVMRYESDAFDAGWPTSVHRIHQLFDNANHLLDSQLQTRISVAFSNAGWPLLDVMPFDGNYRLFQSFVVPWRVLTYGADAPALARAVVGLSGMISDVNEYVESVEFAVSMQSAQQATPRLYGRTIVGRWLASVPVTATTATAAIGSYTDLPEASRQANTPDTCERTIPTRDLDEAGDLYSGVLRTVMVRFNVWGKINWDGLGIDWVVPPAYYSHFFVREGAR